jgi:hypothetical protein
LTHVAEAPYNDGIFKMPMEVLENERGFDGQAFQVP